MQVAFHAPSAGTIATATTEHPSAEAVRALLIQCACVACPLSLGTLTQRELLIERVSPDGAVLASASYAIPAAGDKDRALTFNVDAAVHNGAAVRATISGCAVGESQWVLINYDTVKV